MSTISKGWFQKGGNQLKMVDWNSQKSRKQTYKICNRLYCGSFASQNLLWGFCRKYQKNVQLSLICFLCCAKDGCLVKNIKKDTTNTYHHAKMIGYIETELSKNTYCTLLFSSKENLKPSKVDLVAIYCKCLVDWIMIEQG